MSRLCLTLLETHKWISKAVVPLCLQESVFSICDDVDGTRRYYAKRKKSVRERQILYDLTHMWNLRNKTDDCRGREGKIK